ncbi:MAG: acetylglutamate kinase, partial [Cyclobacteriaceae bacterium]
KTVVANLQSKGCPAIGLTGADANLIHSTKRPPIDGLDYGWVGDPASVNHSFLQLLLQTGMVPVIAPLTHEGEGNLLNTNADTIARFIASSLAQYAKVKLYYAFELPGVLEEITKKESLIKSLERTQYQVAKETGSINEGMIPKLDNAFAAKEAGVAEVALVQYDQLEYLKEEGFDAYTRLH